MLSLPFLYLFLFLHKIVEVKINHNRNLLAFHKKELKNNSNNNKKNISGLDHRNLITEYKDQMVMAQQLIKLKINMEKKEMIELLQNKEISVNVKISCIENNDQLNSATKISPNIKAGGLHEDLSYFFHSE